MNIVSVRHKGSFKNTDNFFNRALKLDYRNILKRYGKLGVEALKSATPINTGKTADSWSYQITEKTGAIQISWNNDNTNNGVNIVVLLVYGHGLANGGYVEGNDFVHPSIKPIMEKLAADAWEEVTK